jgi:hypothetical protein
VVRFLARARYVLLFQRAHSALGFIHPPVRGVQASFPGVKRLRRKFDRSCPTRAEVKNGGGGGDILLPLRGQGELSIKSINRLVFGKQTVPSLPSTKILNAELFVWVSGFRR